MQSPCECPRCDLWLKCCAIKVSAQVVFTPMQSAQPYNPTNMVAELSSTVTADTEVATGSMHQNRSFSSNLRMRTRDAVTQGRAGEMPGVIPGG